MSRDDRYHIYELFWFPSDPDIYSNEQNFTQILCKISAIHNYLVAVGVSPWAGKFQEKNRGQRLFRVILAFRI